MERGLFEEILRGTDGNQLQAAERLGISRVTLRSKLRTWRTDSGIEPAAPPVSETPAE